IIHTRYVYMPDEDFLISEQKEKVRSRQAFPLPVDDAHLERKSAWKGHGQRRRGRDHRGAGRVTRLHSVHLRPEVEIVVVLDRELAPGPRSHELLRRGCTGSYGPDERPFDG